MMNIKRLSLIAISTAIFVAAPSQDVESRLTKGRAFVGLSFGADFKNTNDYSFLGMVNIVSEKKSGGQFDLSGGYFLNKYFSLGGTYQYSDYNRTAITEDADGVRTHTEGINRSHTTGVYMKYFTPLNEQERINLFARVGLSYQNERSFVEAMTSDILTRTFQKKNLVYFGIIPGMQVIVAKGFAVEADISIAGLQSSWTNTWVNNEPTSDISSTNISFDINILSLNIGFFYYF